MIKEAKVFNRYKDGSIRSAHLILPKEFANKMLKVTNVDIESMR